jgi:hypothetical protein
LSVTFTTEVDGEDGEVEKGEMPFVRIISIAFNKNLLFKFSSSRGSESDEVGGRKTFPLLKACKLVESFTFFSPFPLYDSGFEFVEVWKAFSDYHKSIKTRRKPFGV